MLLYFVIDMVLFSGMGDNENDVIDLNLQELDKWGEDFWYFARNILKMQPSEPLDELRGNLLTVTVNGRERQIMLFDSDGRLVHPNLKIYKKHHFKYQGKKEFKEYYRGKAYTWQQTVILEAYQRAIETFDKDSYDIQKRFISVVSGHGIGKTATLANIALHFTLSYMGSQSAATANTEAQIKDIFLKEFAVWRRKLPEYLQGNIEQIDDRIKIAGMKDWFLRAVVARPEKPEAIAGLHAPYVLLIFDEASAIHGKIFEVAKGALTGENFVCLYISNGTRAEGEFYESHKKGSGFTSLAFSSRESPIVKDAFIEKIENDYPPIGDQPSDEVLIRVDGKFPNSDEMDDKGWIPLFANVTMLFEPERGQKFGRCILGLDPAGEGKDLSRCGIRDSVYLKEVFSEKVSQPKPLARKVETIMEVYEIAAVDVAIDGFGEGAKVIAEIDTKVGESVNAVMTDKAREEVKDRFKNFNAELAWRFRQWVLAGGIIITNKPKAWENELSKIKYRRDSQGRIELMGKVEFKREYGFSPDRFDMCKYTFFKEAAYQPPVLKKEQLEAIENAKWLAKVNQQSTAHVDNYSSMG